MSGFSTAFSAAQAKIDRTEFIVAPARGVLQGVSDHIDSALNTYIFNVYGALVQEYSYAITTVLSLYIIFYVIAIYRGLINATTEEMINAVIKMIIVSSLLYSFDDFLRLAYSALTHWPDQIIGTIITSGTTEVALSNAEKAKGVVDLYFDQGFKLGQMVMEQSGFAATLFGLIIWLATFFMGAIPFAMAMVAKVAIGVLLSITPIFLLFMLFKKTSGFFEAWVRNLMSMVFLKILVFSAMIIYLHIMKGPMNELKERAINGDSLGFPNFLTFLVIAYVMWRFYKHIGGIASSLGSGFVLQTSGIASNVANKGFVGSGKYMAGQGKALYSRLRG